MSAAIDPERRPGRLLPAPHAQSPCAAGGPCRPGNGIRRAARSPVAHAQRGPHSRRRRRCPRAGDLLQRYGIEIGAGLGAFKGKVWRIGLMGYGRPPCERVRVSRWRWNNCWLNKVLVSHAVPASRRPIRCTATRTRPNLRPLSARADGGCQPVCKGRVRICGWGCRPNKGREKTRRIANAVT